MKKFKIISLILLAITAVVTVSCVEDDTEDFASGPYVVGFKNTQNSYIYQETDVNPDHFSEAVTLLGGSNGTTSSSDITIPFSVDPSSTAIAGTDYTIDLTVNTVTIPAGSDFVLIPITVNPAVLPGNTPRTIVINLGTSTNGSVVAAPNSSITITIAKCASDLAGLYSLQVTRLDTNAVYNFPNEMITQLSIGEYETSTTGPYFDLTLGGCPRNGFIFNDVCQTIVINEQNLADCYTNLVEGDEDAGSVTLDPVTGDVVSITMHYSIRGFASGVSQRYFTAVYTKL